MFQANSQKPRIICHMMSSIDGKISSGIPGVMVLESYMDVYDDIHNRLQAKTWMCGTVTMEYFAEAIDTPLDLSEEGITTDDFVVNSPQHQYAIALDVKGRLRWKSNEVQIGATGDDNYQLIVIVTEITPKSYLAHLKDKNVAYIFAGENQVDFTVAMEKVKTKFGIETVLLEGGGHINGSMIDVGLIDEISLIMIPAVINNEIAPSAFERNVTGSTLPIHEFELSDTENLGRGLFWLRYKFTGKKVAS